jgi:hypothetical protein
MTNFYVVEIKSDDYRPTYSKFEANTLEEALLTWLSNKHGKSFDGINHARDFIESLSLTLDLYADRELYSVYEKYYQAGISNNLETIMEWLAE